MRALHWIKQALLTFAILLVVCPVYTLMMSMQADALVWEDIPLLTGSFMVMFGMFFSMAFSTLLYTQESDFNALVFFASSWVWPSGSHWQERLVSLFVFCDLSFPVLKSTGPVGPPQ